MTFMSKLDGRSGDAPEKIVKEDTLSGQQDYDNSVMCFEEANLFVS